MPYREATAPGEAMVATERRALFSRRSRWRVATIDRHAVTLERTVVDWGFWFRHERVESERYSTTYGHVWRSDETGHRPNVWREGWLGEVHEAWKHRKGIR